MVEHLTPKSMFLLSTHSPHQWFLHYQVSCPVDRAFSVQTCTRAPCHDSEAHCQSPPIRQSGTFVPTLQALRHRRTIQKCRGCLSPNPVSLFYIQTAVYHSISQSIFWNTFISASDPSLPMPDQRTKSKTDTAIPLPKEQRFLSKTQQQPDHCTLSWVKRQASAELS